MSTCYVSAQDTYFMSLYEKSNPFDQFKSNCTQSQQSHTWNQSNVWNNYSLPANTGTCGGIVGSIGNGYISIIPSINAPK